MTDPGQLHIDHRVALAEASRSGSRRWTGQQRDSFANDRDNLVAVSARVNTSKGDRDPGRWVPPVRDSWCDFAVGYVRTKRDYGLTVDPAERDNLATMLGTCS